MIHSYLVFPALLKIFSVGKENNQLVYTNNEQLPTVAVICAAYNEEQVLEQKLDSILSSNYPTVKLEIWLGSDNSTDRTNNILQQYGDKYNQLKYKIFNSRTGKQQIINQLVQNTQADILFLTDANVFFDPDTIRQNVKHYLNESIGLVGSVIINPDKKAGIAPLEKKYVDRENTIKYHEGLIFGSTIAPFGGAFSLRRKLFSPVPVNWLVDDFYIATKVLQQKYQAIVEMESICYEDVPEEIKQEFNRKKRISTGNFQNLGVFKGILWPPYTGLAFCFLSHKVLRWFTPFFMIATLFSSAFLAIHSNFYALVLLVQLGLIMVAILGLVLNRLGISIKMVRFVNYFYLMNIALLLGFIHYLKGVRQSTWEPTKR